MLREVQFNLWERSNLFDRDAEATEPLTYLLGVRCLTSATAWRAASGYEADVSIGS